ncbi:MAG: 7-carboxy-7-deazaguanine synthase QueE [Lutibacter sp.]|nr:7-carboxy-7-deazaguanine synthase QueE [Lutibacter sp.]
MIDKKTQAQITSGEMLPLMEAFYSIQGEGAHTGKAAYFVRIGGCDVGCHWCDVKESWNPELHPAKCTENIVKNALIQAKTVVVTGGEPLMWNLDFLTKKLRENKLKVHLETSGAYPISGQWDWICLSPKKRKLPREAVYKEAHELKIIISNKHDFIFAEQQAAKVSENCERYLQPEWSKHEKMTPLIVAYVLKHPQWKISLQTHKYLNIP